MAQSSLVTAFRAAASSCSRRWVHSRPRLVTTNNILGGSTPNWCRMSTNADEAGSALAVSTPSRSNDESGVGSTTSTTTASATTSEAPSKPAPTSKPQGIPFMVTRHMREVLQRGLGFSKAQISELTPQRAHDLIETRTAADDVEAVVEEIGSKAAERRRLDALDWDAAAQEIAQLRKRIGRYSSIQSYMTVRWRADFRFLELHVDVRYLYCWDTDVCICMLSCRFYAWSKQSCLL